MSKVPLMLFMGFCLLVSCKTHSSLSKTLVPPPAVAPSLSAVVMDSLKAHEVRFEWFSGKAKIWLEKALRDGGDQDGTVLEHYGDVLYKTGDINGAVQYWMKAKEKNVDSHTIDKKIAERKLYE